MKEPKPPKFNFEALKAGATSENAAVRKKTFQEYFERFHEFPSYLFDNSENIDVRLYETIQELSSDAATPQAMHKAIALLMQRLPSPQHA